MLMAGVDDPVDGLVPLAGFPPDELLPHAETRSPAPASATTQARFLVNCKVILLSLAGRRGGEPHGRHGVGAFARTLRLIAAP
jgi:hypothetical protein